METKKNEEKKVIEEFQSTNKILIFFALLTGIVWIGLITFVIYTTAKRGLPIFSMMKSNYGTTNLDRWLSFCTGYDKKNAQDAEYCGQLLCDEARHDQENTSLREWCNYYTPQQQPIATK
jgi:hypothetical protein